jgi:hypothetical protein
MSRPRISTRDRRAIVLGLVVLGPFIAHRYAIRPYLARTAELQEQIALEAGLLVRERALLEEAEHFRERLGTLQAGYADGRSELLSGATSVEAEGALAAYVAERAESSGILLQRSEGRDREVTEGDLLLGTSVLVQALGDLEGVLRFLHALESGPLLVEVERIQIQPSPLRTTDPAEAWPLQVGALITAYSLTAAPDDRQDVASASGGSP